ncbi:MAG: sulfotransferase [Porticoccaceae bacterium]|nr:sulfotransferase [Porticoccaceae bacterium]
MTNINQSASLAVQADVVPLFVGDLLLSASKITGLTDFGDLHFLKGLAVLTDALREEARLNSMGRLIQSSGIVRLLTNRLRYQDDIKRHPEITLESIDAPIIIVGLPRTGTSKLQRILSADPEVQRLEVWRLLNPAPFPGEQPGNPQERIQAGLAAEQLFATQFPGWMARHPMEARAPDEELFIMEMSFESIVTAMLARIPTFRDFALECDPQATYKILYEMLQYLQWQDGGGRGRPWIMKSPVHIGNLPTLFKFFPNATIVHCHRDPYQIMPSFASLIVEGRRMSSDEINPEEIAYEWLNYWANQIDKNLIDRENLSSHRIIDVHFEDIRKDPIAVVKTIYDKAGRVMTPDTIAAFKAYDQSRPEKYWGDYNYTAEQYGLNKVVIDQRFKNYRKKFID